MRAIIEFKGIELHVVGQYEKAEDRVMYFDNLDGFPGVSASYHLHHIYTSDSDVDIFELFSAADLEEIETKILEQLNE